VPSRPRSGDLQCLPESAKRGRLAFTGASTSVADTYHGWLRAHVDRDARRVCALIADDQLPPGRPYLTETRMQRCVENNRKQLTPESAQRAARYASMDVVDVEIDGDIAMASLRSGSCTLTFSQAQFTRTAGGPWRLGEHAFANFGESLAPRWGTSMARVAATCWSARRRSRCRIARMVSPEPVTAGWHTMVERYRTLGHSSIVVVACADEPTARRWATAADELLTGRVARLGDADTEAAFHARKRIFFATSSTCTAGACRASASPVTRPTCAASSRARVPHVSRRSNRSRSSRIATCADAGRRQARPSHGRTRRLSKVTR
jgi:hypothetical protein